MMTTTMPTPVPRQTENLEDQPTRRAVERLDNRIERYLPPGVIVMWPISYLDVAVQRLAVPDGWLVCDGALHNKNDYKALYEIIGNRYGGVDADGTFATPEIDLSAIHSASEPERFNIVAIIKAR